MKIVKMIIDNKELKALENCMSNDQTRPILYCLHLRADGFIEVTDGKVLLKVPNKQEGIKPGVYKIIGKDKGKMMTEVTLELQEFTFPNTDAIIGEIKEEIANLWIRKGSILSACVIDMFIASGESFQIEYFEKLLPLDTLWKAHERCKGQACLLTSRDMLFLAMPFSYESRVIKQETIAA